MMFPDEIRLQGHTRPIEAYAIHWPTMSLATGSWDRSARIWDLRTGRCLRTFVAEFYVTAVAWSNDVRVLATGGGGSTIRLWNTTDGTSIAELTGHHHPEVSGSIAGLCFSNNGRLLASASADYTARVWRLEPGYPSSVFAGHNAFVRDVVFTADNARLISVSCGRFWCPQGVVPHPTNVTYCGGDIRVWNIEQASPHATLGSHDADVRTLALTPDNRLLATGGNDMRVKVWDMGTGTLLYEHRFHRAVRSVCFDNAGECLASSTPGGISISDARTQKAIWSEDREPRMEEGFGVCGVEKVEFSPDGLLLVVAYTDGRVQFIRWR